MMLFAAMGFFGLFKFILAMLFLTRLRAETGKIRFFGSKHSILLQMSFALPIALSNSIDIISRWLDRFVVSFFLGTEPLGIFSVGAIEIPFITVFVATVYSVISPVLISLNRKEDYEGFLKLITKTLKFTAKFIWPLCIYLFVFADHLIPLVFTRSFNGAVAPFRIYLLLMPIRIFLLGLIVLALGQHRFILYIAAGTLLINIFLNIILVLWIGLLGPAIATVVTAYLQAICMFSFILVKLRTRINRLLPVRTLFDIGLTSILAVIIAYILTWAYMNDLKVVLMSLTIFVGAYIFLGSRTGLFRILSLMDLMEGNFFEKKDKG